jgi:dihydrofolate synthase / folylpolyglutamate synthase
VSSGAAGDRQAAFPTYEAALEWLLGTQLFGIKLGLESIRRLLTALDVPDPQQRIIHVAGTNGKGSVCAMIDAITRAAGYRTGLFTSPHLVTFRERIQVDGKLISRDDVAAGLSMIRQLVADWDPHPTFFELTTALALHHFRATGCELIVFETGMGGRLDATNAVTPVVSVITPIDLDHQKWLGDTLAEIAAEKAGIIKPGVPVVSARQQPEAEEVLRKRAEECGSEIEFIRDAAPHDVALIGPHQKQNAALAVAALRAARIPVAEDAISQGLAHVQWPARFQLFDKQFAIDGAHNPAGARVLADAWRAEFGDEKAILIFGVLRDKNAAETYRALSGIVAEALLPQFTGQRVLPPAQLAELITAISPQTPVTLAASCAEAISRARTSGRRVLVAGSLHLAGEMLASLRGMPAAFEECAQ